MADLNYNYNNGGLISVTTTRRRDRIKNAKVNLISILEDICFVFKQKKSALRSSKRSKELVASRMIFSYVSSLKTAHTDLEIAKEIGRADHTSTGYHRKKATGYLKNQDALFMDKWNYYLENSELFAEKDFNNKLQ